MNKKIPMRTCIACRDTKEKRALIRIVRTPQGEIKLDTTGKLSGRGAYICRRAECFEKVKKSKQLNRAFAMEIPDEVYEVLKSELENCEE